MDLDITQDRENTLFQRRELVIALPHPGTATPSLMTTQAALAKHFKMAHEQIDIRSLTSNKGLPSSVLRVYLWNEKKVADLSKPKEEKKPEGAA